MSPAYPRPQLVRDDWTSLNGPWRFTFDDGHLYRKPADITSWASEIIVPYPPESLASGIGDRGFHRRCWYQRTIELSSPPSTRTILHFGAVDYAASVWLDDTLVATHEGGHTPFSVELEDGHGAPSTHLLTLRVDDDPHDLAKPRGKQDWELEPHAIWYPRTTGVWQTVWLERVPSTYIEKIRWTPFVEGFAIGLEARIAGEVSDELTLEIELRHGARLLARDAYLVLDGEVDRRIVLSDPGIDDYRNDILWCPEQPTLLDAVLRLRRGHETVDTVRSYTALRSVQILRERFMLNGRPYPLRLVLDQGYWPDTLLAAPNDRALRTDVELAKAMGFNGVRKHQKVEDPRYLYWADVLGLLVWEEMPSAYRFTQTAIKRTVREWTEVIDRDYNHPCVVVWVPFNESWGVPELPSIQAHRHAVEALYHLTRTLDTTRLVVGNDGWESSATDIIGIHDYDDDPGRLRERYGADVPPQELFERRRPGGRVLTLEGYPHRGQPIMLTEFGGIAFDPVAGPEQDATWGYSTARDAADLLERVSGLVGVVSQAGIFSGYCYTQLTDTFQEANGLLYADRTPKVPLERIAAIITRYVTRIPGVV